MTADPPAPSRPCRICQTDSAPFHADERTFYRCPACSLVFTDQHWDRDASDAHYRGQTGNVDAAFWAQQCDALLGVIRRYHEPRRILDFGAGAMLITAEFARRGFDITPVEPMVHGYLRDQPECEPFDTVIGVEVVEHLPNLWDELLEINRRLARGGVMVFTTILTDAFIDAPDAARQFAGWWYKDDQTHVSFFCTKALAMMSQMLAMPIDVYGGQLFVIRKGAPPAGGAAAR